MKNNLIKLVILLVIIIASYFLINYWLDWRDSKKVQASDKQIQQVLKEIERLELSNKNLSEDFNRLISDYSKRNQALNNLKLSIRDTDNKLKSISNRIILPKKIENNLTNQERCANIKKLLKELGYQFPESLCGQERKLCEN